MLFGITSSVYKVFLRFSRRILLRILSRYSLSKVKLLTSEEASTYQECITEKYVMLGDLYAVSNDSKLYKEQAGDKVIQNMFYNGWKHDRYVGSVILFAPSGIIISWTTNAPGSMHDTQIIDWSDLYTILEDFYSYVKRKLVVDSAFCKSSYLFLIKSTQNETVGEKVEKVVRLRQATSIRQPAEWEMRAYQGSHSRLKGHFY